LPDVASQQISLFPPYGIHVRRIAVKKTSLTLAAVIALAIAGSATSFAAELPTYEVQGLPISPVQASVLGAADVSEQPQVAPAAASPHQVSVLTPRKLKTATAAPTTVGRAH
jgi:hypothetical protein